MTTSASRPRAVLHRMVMPGHVCPFGLKARHLLRSHGYDVEDRWLETREATDAFKAAHDVKTTPQVFIDGVRIGTDVKLAGIKAVDTPFSPWGLRIEGKPALSGLDAFARGAIEVQDEGSQLLAALVPHSTPLGWIDSP